LAVKPFPVDRSREYWTPPGKLWAGDTAFVLGGGYSLNGFDCTVLRPHGWVLTINSTFTLAPFCDALFFNDYSWFMGRWGERGEGGLRRGTIETSEALVVTPSRQAKGVSPDRLRLVKMSAGAGLDHLRQGRSSGHSAISLAITLGAKRVALLGFDMKPVAGRSHHHREYGTSDDRLYAKDFIPAFGGWDKDARKIGVEILNATPGSALKEFRKAELETLIR